MIAKIMTIIAIVSNITFVGHYEGTTNYGTIKVLGNIYQDHYMVVETMSDDRVEDMEDIYGGDIEGACAMVSGDLESMIRITVHETLN